MDGRLKVWVTSSPTDGQANEAVCQVLAKALKLPPSSVTIRKGHASRDKSIDVQGLTFDEAVERLNLA